MHVASEDLRAAHKTAAIEHQPQSEERAIGQQAQLAAENFLNALAQHRPVVLADLEMPSQIEQCPLANFVAEAFGTHEAVGKVGGAGRGGTGLGASNEHIETLSEVGGGSNIFYIIY